MSDVLQTAILNWLRATADDAMGMEPGDRHMANETYKEIERLQAKIDTDHVQHMLNIKRKDAEIERLNKRHDDFLQEFWKTNAENERLLDKLREMGDG